MEKQHSQRFLQKRKLLVFLPIVGVPFLAIFFSLMGGGSQAMAGKNQFVTGTMGLNTVVPNASEENKIYASKIKAYEQVALDSATRKKNNSRSLLDTDLMGLFRSDTVKGTATSSDHSPSSNPGAYNYDLNRGFADQANAPERLALEEGQRELEEARRLASGNGAPGTGYSSGGGAGRYRTSVPGDPSTEAENAGRH
jgi:hypothetical protein